MLEVQFIAYVAERDMDLLLLEELTVSESFRMWFSKKAAASREYRCKLGAWHSVVDSTLGESDLVFMFLSRTGERVAVLIENKIDAAAQDEHPKRYRERGDKGIACGYWDRFTTCVIAPKRYLASSVHPGGYDAEITYEDVLDNFRFRALRASDPRASFKAAMTQEAIEQNRRGYQAEHCPVMTKFVADYREQAMRVFPELMMQPAKSRPRGSTWITFHPEGLPGNAYICHQLTAGAVKLFFGPPSSLDAVSEAYRPHLPDRVAIEAAGKSVALIIEVPRIDPLNQSVSKQEAEVFQGLKAAALLLEAARRVAASPGSRTATAVV